MFRSPRPLGVWPFWLRIGRIRLGIAHRLEPPFPPWRDAGRLGVHGAAESLIGNRQPVLKWRGIGLLGLRQQLLDFHFQIVEFLIGVAVADSGMLAGVCQNFRAIDGNSHLPDFQDAARRGHFQNLGKGSLEERAVVSPECAKGVMVGMDVGTHQARSHISVGGALDLPAGKHSRAVGILTRRAK